MKRAWVLALGGFVAAVGLSAYLGILASDGSSAPTMTKTTHYTSERGVKVTVTQPGTNAVVTSPVQVVGRVPGLWSFEASFGVQVLNADHDVLGQHYATVTGDWMTDADVDFNSTVKFTKPDTDTGFVVLLRANPEGGPRGEDSVEIPVRFAD